MLSKKIALLLLICLLSCSVFSQETGYSDHTLTYTKKPAYPQYAGYTTFDFGAITTMDGVNVTLPYQLKLEGLSQVPASNDFHFLSLISRLGIKFTADNAAVVNTYITTYGYDRYGTRVMAIYTDKPDLAVKLDRPLSKEERGNADLVRQLFIGKLSERNISNFITELKGGPAELAYELAGLNDVSKMADLKEFSKTTKPVPYSANTETVLKAMEPNVAYWENTSTYSGTGEVNEVKRAALQNLSVYSILAGDYDKAAVYIAEYKKVDKIHKMMMGLLKVMHSENCEKMLASFNPSPAFVDESAPAVTLAKLMSDFKFLEFKGTITIDNKKTAGTYTGLIQVSKLPIQESSGIASFDASGPEVFITTTDEAGKEKKIRTDLTHVTALKEESGQEYYIRNFGMITGDYYLLKPSFQSAKVNVYRTVIPAGVADYVVRKAGDEKGLKSGLFTSFSKLYEYLGDCPAIAAKAKDPVRETVEKIAELYSNCSN